MHTSTQRTFDGARRQLYHDEGWGCSLEQQGRTLERPQFVPIDVNFHYEKTVANGTRAKLESISSACENDVNSGDADTLDCAALCCSLGCISSSQCLPVCAEVQLSVVEVGAVTNCNVVPEAESTETLETIGCISSTRVQADAAGKVAVQLDRSRDSARVPGQPLHAHAVKAVRSSSKRCASEVAPNIQQLPEVGRDIGAITACA